MSKLRKIAAGGFGLIALGYALGILTAPKSGKQTRKKIKKTAKNSVSDIERDLKTIYSQTKDTLDKLSKNNPEITSKYKDVKSTATKSQAKLKNILSSLHGQDNLDEDLTNALKDSKQVLADLKNFLKK